LRASLHDRSKTSVCGFEGDHGQERDPERACPASNGADTGSSETIALERKRPAAIRQLGATGKVPVMTDKDARHPNSKNHGRIAGR
jgi:hypothetical protein